MTQMEMTRMIQRLTILVITVASSISITISISYAQETKFKKRDGQSPALTKSAADQYLLKDTDRQLTQFKAEQRPVHQARVPTEADLITLINKGSSTRFTRKAYLSRIPLDKLTPANRTNAEYVLKDLSMFRALPKIQVEVNHSAYAFFIAHPDVVVSIWRDMKLSEFQMWQTGPFSYEVDAGDGTIGTLDVIHQTPTETIVLCSGVYKSPLIAKPIAAKALLFLETKYHSGGKNQRDSVSHQVSMFVSFPSQTVEMAAKILAPVSNVILDRNFKEVSIFMHMMSLAMERQPGWVERVAKRLEGVLPIRQPQLLKVAARVYIDGQRRNNAAEPNRLQPPQPIDAISQNNAKAPRKLPTDVEVKSVSRAQNPM
ncbi:MAG: hypothetical protein K0U86_23605 [Planctomycetes bacterium]|nr:hypothetical protein [Planctomycetota bacterium]MCH9727899.1 hypothetical protein [Planctomycetota bacterium]MCH9778334.1 hypothetical protein [Planctomycetota bacterium]MCH9792900.1 hypothetical protein [Planctomycetota bacterium]